MKTLITVALLSAGILGARAQSDMIILQRARNLQNANNQQVNSERAADAAANNPAPPAPAPGSPAAIVAAPPPVPVVAPVPPPPPLTAELKQNLDKLGADLTAIKAGSNVTDD